MKIRFKLALQYSCVTAVLMLVFALVVYLVSANNRKKEFYSDLKREGISKANLFFEAKATPEIMHSIYMNNIEYIDEVEVAVYDKSFNLLYHDAKDIDIIKETPELIHKVIVSEKGISFYVGKYQATCFLFSYKGMDYVVTAAAYDGYGYKKLDSLALNLLLLSTASILLAFLLGYFMAKRALKPVGEISARMKDITANNLNLRLLTYNQKDEFGELATSFNKSLDIIENSFESQKMFVSNVSHELRTPLAALIGEIDLSLLKDRSPEEYRKTLSVIRQDTGRLIKLINGLLDLAKASYDESKISMSDVRLDELLLDAREVVLKGDKKYTIDLQFNQEIEKESEITINGNGYLLKTAFINLMENNCKFSDNNKSTVSISFAGNEINLRFMDSGIGISPEEIESVFLPFYRGKNKEYSVGNGIGLALVQRVVSLHKGNIEIISKPGQGTVFTLRFPNSYFPASKR